MMTQTLPIWEENQAVYLETYILKNSLEFQTNTRRRAALPCPERQREQQVARSEQ